MKISNFQMVKVVAMGSGLSSTLLIKATVDVTTGVIFKKTVTRSVFSKNRITWRFLHNGELTPGYCVENLAHSFESVAEELLEDWEG